MMSGFYIICEWVMRLAYLNILWLFFTIVGFIVFGFFPATTAMFAVVRKWLMKETDLPVFKTFWGYYKSDLVKSNLLGLVILIVGYILYIDITMLRNASGVIQIFYIPSLIITLGFVLTVFYMFPTYVHYDIGILQVAKNSFFIMVLNPMSTIMMFIGSTIFYYLLKGVPGLAPFVSGSAFAYLVMWSAILAFSKIQRKQEASTQIQQ